VGWRMWVTTAVARATKGNTRGQSRCGGGGKVKKFNRAKTRARLRQPAHKGIEQGFS
jgi:hypothetical protein